MLEYLKRVYCRPATLWDVIFYGTWAAAMVWSYA